MKPSYSENQTGDDLLDNQEVEPSEPARQRPVPILDRWELSHDEFTSIIDSNPSLRGVTLGYIAEWKFHEMFLNNPNITEAQKDDDHNRKRKGDRRFKYRGHEFIVEVKSLQTNLVKRLPDGTSTGRSQVDASDRRKVEFKDGSTLETTCLLRGEFDVLAVNCYAFNGKWEFAFALNSDLPQNTFRKYTEEQRAALLPSLIPVTWPVQEPFVTDIIPLLDRVVAAREAGKEPEVPEVPVRSITD
ncbi:hypothetical protein [Achromobacter xylosoxidans]|uniref:hypothetical protein n=1 Tax=Alcaligenes xylosoxydans xylosoxydans TaxID=85698 RepID=UPI001A948BCB|nr:hypothetical protein [Achromobacter xylosoxidans]